MAFLLLAKYQTEELWLQIAIFWEYLKSDEVTMIDINTLDLKECVKFVEEYFQTQSGVDISLFNLFHTIKEWEKDLPILHDGE